MNVYDIQDLAWYRERLYQAEHAELDGRLTDREENAKTIRLCKKRIKDIESRPTFAPQCHSLDPGVYGRAGWASDEERLA